MRTLYKIHKIHRVDYHPELDKFEVVVLCSLNGGASLQAVLLQ